jgi:hypothetical protein
MTTSRKVVVSHDVYRPVVGLVVRLIILGIIYWILTSLPMLKQLSIPKLPISAGAIVSIIIGIIMIAMLLTFRRDFAPRLQAAVPTFPESGTIVISAVNLAIITIAFTMFNEAVSPFLKQYTWVYPLFFVLIAIWPLSVLIMTLYRSSDKIAELTTGKIAQASGELVKCNECGELIISTAVFCPNCSTKLAVPETESVVVTCSSCNAQNRSKDKYCLACGKPLVAEEPGKKIIKRRKWQK